MFLCYCSDWIAQSKEGDETLRMRFEERNVDTNVPLLTRLVSRSLDGYIYYFEFTYYFVHKKIRVVDDLSFSLCCEQQDPFHASECPVS